MQAIKKTSVYLVIALFVVAIILLLFSLPQKVYADANYVIGDTGPGGGKIFYVDEDNKYPWDYLEAAPVDQGDPTWGSTWSNIIDLTAGASGTAIGTGKANTAAIIAQPGHTSSAAKLCVDYVSPTGYSDWYLPSEEEAIKIMENRIEAGIEGLKHPFGYWSSTEKGPNVAYAIALTTGVDGTNSKSNGYNVRAIRAGKVMEGVKTGSGTKTAEPAPWVRNVQMTCYQVWINDDNNFEFVFWWEYKNNNWVKIYDMAGSEVFSIDMKYGNARFEAELPDGMYTVKTFHLGETPIQEFIIGKP